MSSKNYKPTMSRVAEARSEGQYCRAKTFGKKDKSPRADRRNVKKEIRKYI